LTTVLNAKGLSKRFGRRLALSECTVELAEAGAMLERLKPVSQALEEIRDLLKEPVSVPGQKGRGAAREKGTGAAGAPAESVARGALQRELAPIRSKQRVVASCTATSTPLTSPALDLEPQKRELECQRPDPMAG
jgi:hypothetical protein